MKVWICSLLVLVLLFSSIPTIEGTSLARAATAPTYAPLSTASTVTSDAYATAPQITTSATGSGGECFPQLNAQSSTSAVTASSDTYITTAASSITSSPNFPTNRTMDTAIALTPNVPVEGYIPPSEEDCVYFKQGVWYSITVAKKQKVTALLLVPPGLDYSLFMGTTGSFRKDGPYDLLSFVAEPGTYYLHVTEWRTKGSLEQPFNLKVMLYDQFDDYEQYYDDGHATDAGVNVYDPTPFVQTIDSVFDEDWKSFFLWDKGKLTVSLKNPSHSKGVYKVEVWDWDNHLITTIQQNSSKTFAVPDGPYYTRVYSSSFRYDATVPYSLSIGFAADPQPVCHEDEERPWEWICEYP
ncbi:hypothetical protein [Paenibacillus kandeliae]|uniref:hypothetical protein n=1 Tax=Paenibacillus kandeliae TaxID=3231269 RepID=UPI00345940FB